MKGDAYGFFASAVLAQLEDLEGPERIRVLEKLLGQLWRAEPNDVDRRLAIIVERVVDTVQTVARSSLWKLDLPEGFAVDVARNAASALLGLMDPDLLPHSAKLVGVYHDTPLADILDAIDEWAGGDDACLVETVGDMLELAEMRNAENASTRTPVEDPE